MKTKDLVIDIFNILNNDSTLIEMIGGNHIYPIETNYTGECIIYDYYTTSYDKCKKYARLQITIIATTIVKTLEVEDRVNELLTTLGDENKTNNVLKVQVNGGGSLYDYARNMNHRIINYDIIGR